MSAQIVNLFGAPGAGKSTGAAYIFSKLKLAGVNAELVTEFAKDKVWESSWISLANQAYMFGQQSFRLSRCADKVDIIVTDSPLPLSVIYNTDSSLGESFDKTVFNVFNSYHNINYYVNRVKQYNPSGRVQTVDESDGIALKIQAMLNKHNIDYKSFDGNAQGFDMIVEDILSQMKQFREV